MSSSSISTRLSSAPPPPSWKFKLHAPFTKVHERFSTAGAASPGRLQSAPRSGSRSDPAPPACLCGSDAPVLNAAQSAPALRPGAGVLVFLLSLYKAFLSPLLPSSCKFYPTCSEYAKQAVERHGVGQGLNLAIRRLLRCRPFSPGGYDPVPDA